MIVSIKSKEHVRRLSGSIETYVGVVVVVWLLFDEEQADKRLFFGVEEVCGKVVCRKYCIVVAS
jgi:hypothetical protein